MLVSASITNVLIANLLPRLRSSDSSLRCRAQASRIWACVSAAEAPLIELVRRLWADGRDEVGAGEDNSAIIKRWERLNQVTIGDTPAARPADRP